MNNFIRSWVIGNRILFFTLEVTEEYCLTINNLNKSITESSYTHRGGWDMTDISYLSRILSTDLNVAVSGRFCIDICFHQRHGKGVIVVSCFQPINNPCFLSGKISTDSTDFIGIFNGFNFFNDGEGGKKIISKTYDIGYLCVDGSIVWSGKFIDFSQRILVVKWLNNVKDSIPILVWNDLLRCGIVACIYIIVGCNNLSASRDKGLRNPSSSRTLKVL